MAVKYYCPKCGRRFVDWGAEKLGFKCPSDTCEGEELVLVGAESSEVVSSVQKVKRAKKRKAIVPNVSADIDVPELETEFAEDVDIDEDEDDLEEEEEEEEGAAVLVADDDNSVVVPAEDDDAEEVEDDETFSDALDIDEEDLEEEEEQ